MSCTHYGITVGVERIIQLQRV